MITGSGRLNAKNNIHETHRACCPPPAESKSVHLRVGEKVADHGLGQRNGEGGGQAYVISYQIRRARDESEEERTHLAERG